MDPIIKNVEANMATRTVVSGRNDARMLDVEFHYPYFYARNPDTNEMNKIVYADVLSPDESISTVNETVFCKECYTAFFMSTRIKQFVCDKCKFHLKY